MSIEASITISRALPESQKTKEERKQLRNEFHFAEKAYRRWRQFSSYTAHLPYVLGYLPERDREYLDSVTARYHDKFRAIDVYQRLFRVKHKLPGFFRMIEDDTNFLRSIGIRPPQRILLEVGKKGASAKSGVWHVDADFSDHGIFRPIYICSSNNGSEIYEGEATLESEIRGRHQNYDVERESLDTRVVPFKAPDYAVVRMTPITIHRTPAGPEKTFLRY